MSKNFDFNTIDRVGKAYLVEYLVVENGQSRADAIESVDAVLEGIATAIRAGISVSLSNIGTLRMVELAERMRRNPATGENFLAPAVKTVKFRPSPTLLDVLNGRADRDKLAVKAPKGSLT